MPAIREIHFTHPINGTPGIWFDLTVVPPGLVGLTQTEIVALVPGGNPATRLARFEVSLNSSLQALCELSFPMADLAPDDPIVLDQIAEFGCRIQGAYYIIRIVKITVPVISITPTITYGAITVEESASRSIYV